MSKSLKLIPAKCSFFKNPLKFVPANNSDLKVRNCRLIPLFGVEGMLLVGEKTNDPQLYTFPLAHTPLNNTTETKGDTASPWDRVWDEGLPSLCFDQHWIHKKVHADAVQLATKKVIQKSLFPWLS